MFMLRKTMIAGLVACAGLAVSSCSAREPGHEAAAQAAPSRAVSWPADPAEPRLAGLVRLTDAGANAEAYFSADGRQLIYQATVEGEHACDQIFVIDVDGTGRRRVSTGEGRTTCGYFFPAGDRVLFSSTHHIDAACPPRPDRSRGYVWALYPYDIFVARPDGSELRNLTDHDGYDAEATISPDGRTIVFTSFRDGDLDIYAMDADGSNVRRLTHEPGYDGGPFFSPDGTRIVYRAHHPTDPAELAEYRELLAQRLVRPDRVELFIMDADGSNQRQLTSNGAANFAPFFHPNGRAIIFSSNLHDPSGRTFNLFLLDIESGAIEQVTRHAGFDSFPMFSPDGTKLVFVSNRGDDRPGRYDVFIADWIDER
jgi:TolB protein